MYSQNVGINTKTPKNTLDVEGTVRISNNVEENKPKILKEGVGYKQIYVNSDTGQLYYAPDGTTSVIGGYRPGTNFTIATLPVNNTIVRVRFIHHVDQSSDVNNARTAAYTYGDFTIIGMGPGNPIRFVEVNIKGHDEKSRTLDESNATRIAWDNDAVGRISITINQKTGELKTTSTLSVFSYAFELLADYSF